MLQTSQELLDVANTLSTTGWIPKGVIVKVLHTKCVGKAGVVGELAKGGVVKSSSVAIPESNTRHELSRRAATCKIALGHDVLIAVEEGQGSHEGARVVRLGKVHDFLGDILVVPPIIVSAGRETIGMTLEQMNLLDLAAVGKSDIHDAEIVLGVVSVWGDLAPVLGDCTYIRQKVSRWHSLLPDVRSRLSLYGSDKYESSNE